MCQTNSWKELSAITKDENLIITARRSDNIIFRLVEDSNIKGLSLADKFKDIINKLETYRNCKCTNNLRCDLHNIKTEKEQ